mgnify:CR=1 FL=1
MSDALGRVALYPLGGVAAAFEHAVDHLARVHVRSGLVAHPQEHQQGAVGADLVQDVGLDEALSLQRHVVEWPLVRVVANGLGYLIDERFRVVATRREVLAGDAGALVRVALLLGFEFRDVVKQRRHTNHVHVGPQTGKQVGQTGPMNQVFRSPFCFVYSTDASADYQHFAAYLTSIWSLRGNGHACAVPYSELTDEIRQERNIIYLGIPFEDLPNHESLPFSYSESAVSIGNNTYSGAVGIYTFPEGDGMAMAWYASGGNTQLLNNYTPFSSRSGMPDYLLFDSQGGAAIGFFDANWQFSSDFGVFR